MEFGTYCAERVSVAVRKGGGTTIRERVGGARRFMQGRRGDSLGHF